MRNIKMCWLIIFFLILKTKSSLIIPTIAIYANMNPDTSEDYYSDKVNVNYVRWLESCAAQVIVIHSWNSLEEIDDILSKSNGVLFQGGARNLNLSLEWEKKSLYILNKVIEYNDKGVYYPLWGTCQGFELLHALVANTTQVLESYNAYNIASPIEFVHETLSYSKMFGHFSLNERENIENQNITQQFHHLGISLGAYYKYKSLLDFFLVTSIGRDLNSQIYVATVEARKYPIYAVQFHPEKTPFDKNSKDKIPQSLAAISVSQSFSQFFVEETKKNPHIITEPDKIKYDFIDTYSQGNRKYEKGYYVYKKEERSLIFLE
jgi:gamma-glutamyl hydrolase